MIYEYPVEDVTELHTRAGSSVNTRIVAADWTVKVHRLQRTLTVPEGFEFDEDSVPRIPLVYLVFKGRSGLRAPCLHDYLYSIKPPETSRLEADLLYWDTMRAHRVSLFWAVFHFLGVRIGGGRGWKKRGDV